MVIDLANVLQWSKWLIVAALLLVGVLAVFGPAIKAWANKVVKDRPVESDEPVVRTRYAAPDIKPRSSDVPPPAGFATHLKIIQETAPNADPAIWWEYALKEMTEAQVAKAEAKLARLDIATLKAKPVEKGGAA